LIAGLAWVVLWVGGMLDWCADGLEGTYVHTRKPDYPRQKVRYLRGSRAFVKLLRIALVTAFLLTCPAATADQGTSDIASSGVVAEVTGAEQQVGDEGIRERLDRLREQAAEEVDRWRERLDEQLPAIREEVARLLERLREQLDRALGRGPEM